jgi:hypothetical protein
MADCQKSISNPRMEGTSFFSSFYVFWEEHQVILEGRQGVE